MTFISDEYERAKKGKQTTLSLLPLSPSPSYPNGNEMFPSKNHIAHSRGNLVADQKQGNIRHSR
jgi:hypothetical protein